MCQICNLLCCPAEEIAAAGVAASAADAIWRSRWIERYRLQSKQIELEITLQSHKTVVFMLDVCMMFAYRCTQMMYTCSTH